MCSVPSELGVMTGFDDSVNMCIHTFDLVRVQEMSFSEEITQCITI